MNAPRGNDGFPKFWIPGSTIGNLEISEVRCESQKSRESDRNTWIHWKSRESREYEIRHFPLVNVLSLDVLFIYIKVICASTTTHQKI